MSYYKQLKGEIRRRKLNKFNSIPFKTFERFRYDWPGIQWSNYTILTASSGIGKTKMMLHFYVDQALNFVRDNPDSGIDVDIHIWPLEEGREKLYLTFVSQELFNRFGKVVDIRTLKGIFADKRIDDETDKLLDQLDDWFEFFESKVTIHEEKSAGGAFKVMTELLDRNGKVVEEIQTVNGEKTKIKVYKPNNPKLLRVVIADHIGLWAKTDKFPTTWEAMQFWSTICALKLRDFYGCQVTDVQQQKSSQETQEFHQGRSLAEKLEPSLDGLADNTTTQRNANEVIGIFAPDRYSIDVHKGYNISMLGNYYRSIKVLKSRDGTPGASIGMLFNGAVNSFEELPPSDQLKQSHYVELLKKINAKDEPEEFLL